MFSASWLWCALPFSWGVRRLGVGPLLMGEVPLAIRFWGFHYLYYSHRFTPVSPPSNRSSERLSHTSMLCPVLDPEFRVPAFRDWWCDFCPNPHLTSRFGPTLALLSSTRRGYAFYSDARTCGSHMKWVIESTVSPDPALTDARINRRGHEKRCSMRLTIALLNVFNERVRGHHMSRN